MTGSSSRLPFVVALVAALLGLTFAWSSTSDYASHLDRRLHDLHCSFIPGAPATEDAEPCRAALYSPYSAVAKDRYWGGIPVSLFALGAYTFFGAFGIYLALSGPRAPRRAVIFFALTSLTPLLVSVLMFYISATKLGTFCKTCVGLYVSSFLLAIGGILGLATIREGAGPPRGGGNATPERPVVGAVLPTAWLAALAVATLVPAAVYAAAAPDHRPYLRGCGKLEKPKDPHQALVRVTSPQSVQPATLFEDPLCPTCKALHERLASEGIQPKLDVRLVLFPLDSECNWMLDHPLHPGACVVARAVLCGGPRSLQVLDWAYEEQEYLTRAGRKNAETLKEVVRRRWGEELVDCIDRKETKRRLDRHLHYAIDNHVPVSTPQMFVGRTRICEEDTDLGLVFTLRQLAPAVLQ